MATFSVQFADGTSHTYDNVPNGVTQEQVNVRARTDFPDKEIQDVNTGAAPEAPKLLPPAPEPTNVEKGLGVAQTGLGLANEFLSSPLGHTVEIGAGGAYGLKKLNDLASRIGTAVSGTPVAQGPVAPTGPQIQVPQNVGGGPRAVPAPLNTPTQTFNALQMPEPTVAPQAAQAEMAAGRNAAQNASRYGQLAQRLAPAMQTLNQVSVLPGALSLPYMGAAYEQAKIRQNPNAAGLESNPYAQFVRGEYATQGQAGAANQRQAVRNQGYGALSQEERQILEQDKIDQAMRLAAARKALGQ